SFCGLGPFSQLRSLLAQLHGRCGLALSLGSLSLCVELVNLCFELVYAGLDFWIGTSPIGLFGIGHAFFQGSNLVLVLANLVARNEANLFPLILYLTPPGLDRKSTRLNSS